MNRRAVQVGWKLAEHPDQSLPQQMQGWSDLLGAYRLLNNPKVKMEALLEPHLRHTRQAAGASELVLWLEDTTELDYTAHRATQGLGPIGDGHGQGILLHSTLGVLPGTRQVLGLGHVQALLRTPKKAKQDPENRSAEARVWETSAQRIGRAPNGQTWVHVSDSGSDMFEYMLACRQQDKHFLIRLWRNRLLTWADGQSEAEQEQARKILDYARSLAAVAGSEYRLKLPATRKYPAREAQIVLAWAPITLSAPRRATQAAKQAAPLSLWVLRAWEPEPPEGADRVEWILLSSLPVRTLPEAQEKVDWYDTRWMCEDFHQCLKTGCRIEHSQLDHREDLEKLLGFAAPIAIRLLQLRQAVRLLPDLPAEQAVEPLMLQVLAARLDTDPQTMTLDQFWRGVARLGGHLGRRSDGPPGWRTLWRGWRYLADLTDGARLIRDAPDTCV